MAALAEVVFALGFAKADTRELDEATKKAKARAKEVAEEWRKVGKSIATSIAGAAATISGVTAGVVAFVDRTSAATAETDAWAKKIGTTTQALQRLEFAGAKTGASTDHVREAVKTLRENLGELARVGTGPAADSLSTLGIRLSEINGLDAEGQLGLIAERLNALPDQAQRVSVALELMGEDGGALLPLFAEGAGAIKAYGDEAERLGAVLSDDAVRGAVDVQRSLQTTKAALAGIAQTISADAIPVVKDLLVELQAWIGENRELVREELRDFIHGVATACRQLLPALGQLAKLAVDVGGAFGSLATTLGPTGLIVAITGARLGIATLGTSFQTLLPHIAAVTAAVVAGSAAINAFADAKIRALESGAIQGRKLRAEDVQDQTDAELREQLRTVVQPGSQTARDIEAILRERDQLARGFDPLNAAAAKTLAERSRIETDLGRIRRKLKEDIKPKRGGARRPAEEIIIDEFDIDELFGAEIRRLAAQDDLGEIAIQAALEAGAAALREGSTQGVARNAALSRLGGFSGRNLTTPQRDPLLSELLGQDVPDVELSAIARGAQPQTLISTINNTFNFDNDFAISGAGDPSGVAEQVASQLRDSFQGSIAASTKTAKVVFAR